MGFKDDFAEGMDTLSPQSIKETIKQTTIVQTKQYAKMEIKDLSEPLDINSLEFRIQSINKGGYATILVYKDARVDMERLDVVVGALNWKREHSRDNKNCVVSIYNKATTQWIGKEDTGTESTTEKEKGVCSDSFKRACTNWGIGRELYAYPSIQISLKNNEYKLIEKKDNYGNKKEIGQATYDLKLKEWVWQSKFDGKKIIALRGTDNHGKIRFDWSLSNRKETQPTTKEEPKKEAYPVERYTKGAKAIFEGKTTIEDIRKTFTVSETAKAVIMANVLNIQEKAESEKQTIK